MTNHHAYSCHFLLKIHQSLSYLDIGLNYAFKKKQHFQHNKSYDKNRSYVRSLIDAGFIPFRNVDKDHFIDIFDRNHSLFTPYIINCLEGYDDNEGGKELWHIGAPLFIDK